VAKETRGSGVRRALLDAVKALASGAGVRDVRLDYWSFTMRAAAGFFARQGFAPYNITARKQLTDGNQARPVRLTIGYCNQFPSRINSRPASSFSSRQAWMRSGLTRTIESAQARGSELCFNW